MDPQPRAPKLERHYPRAAVAALPQVRPRVHRPLHRPQADHVAAGDDAGARHAAVDDKIAGVADGRTCGDRADVEVARRPQEALEGGRGRRRF